MITYAGPSTKLVKIAILDAPNYNKHSYQLEPSFETS